MSQELIERLRHHHEHPVTGQMVLINPDGPRAAERIAELEAERDEALRLLKMSHRATALRDAEFRAVKAESALSLAESRGRQIGREEAARVADAAFAQWAAGTPPRLPQAALGASDIAAAIRNLPTNEAGE